MLSANSAVPMNPSHNAAILVTAVLICVSQGNKAAHQSSVFMQVLNTKVSSTLPVGLMLPPGPCRVNYFNAAGD